ncbi:hypothetical protein X777_00258 [Ooceraea biroi]|uniref:Uncharacterized protein n=1 Tax=Ooceraea biroi TaxID=2015173 RepID=A0A026VRJ0_OOCBI|nr:hypothetical protein X777_00258 [Ooceraea biroi]
MSAISDEKLYMLFAFSKLAIILDLGWKVFPLWKFIQLGAFGLAFVPIDAVPF